MKLTHTIIFVALVLFFSTAVALGARAEFGFHPTYPYAHWLETVPSWIGVFAQFDGVHYLTIARQGYEQLGLIQAFFPVYPLIIRFLSFGSDDFARLITVGRLISIVCLVGVGMVWFKQSVFVKDASSLGKSFAFFLLWPVSFFLFSLYNESFFVLSVLGSLLLARKKQWLLAGVVAGYASGTRIVGVLLFPALLIELALQTKYQWTNTVAWVAGNIQKILFISLSLVGWAAYSLYLYKTFGDPLQYLHVQQEFGAGRQESIILLPQVIVRYIKMLLTVQLSPGWLVIAQEFFLSMGAFLLLIFGWRKVRLSILVFSFAALLVPTLTGTFSSMPRYILSAPAVFLILGQYAQQHRWVYYGSLAVSMMLLGFNLWLYGQGLWVS